MRASYNWLRELSGVDAPADEIADKLTGAGLEVEGVERLGEGLEGVVVAEVRGVRPHPHRDRLRLVRVFDGAGEHEVVCGAPNVPDAGGRVLLARLGATLPGGLEIAERDLGGVVSRGMLCSEVELGIGADAACGLDQRLDGSHQGVTRVDVDARITVCDRGRGRRFCMIGHGASV